MYTYVWVYTREYWMIYREPGFLAVDLVPGVTNVFYFLSSWPPIHSATTAVFGSYLSSLYFLLPLWPCLSVWVERFCGSQKEDEPPQYLRALCWPHKADIQRLAAILAWIVILSAFGADTIAEVNLLISPFLNWSLDLLGRLTPLPVFTRGGSRGGGNGSSKRGYQGGRGTAGRYGRWSSHPPSLVTPLQIHSLNIHHCNFFCIVIFVKKTF